MGASDIFSSNTNGGYIQIIRARVWNLSLTPLEDFEHWFASSVMRGKTKNWKTKKKMPRRPEIFDKQRDNLVLGYRTFQKAKI